VVWRTLRSRLQCAPLYIRGKVFSLSEQRTIILGPHFLGYTTEHIAPVFGLQEDESGEPAKGAEVIEAAYEFLKAGRMYQGSTGLWAKADIWPLSSPLHFLCLTLVFLTLGRP